MITKVDGYPVKRWEVTFMIEDDYARIEEEPLSKAELLDMFESAIDEVAMSRFGLEAYALKLKRV